jgi:PadR family transcriptional regulator
MVTYQRHKRAYPCSFAMGNISRFIEPVVLLMLKERGYSHGYGLSQQFSEYALTDAQIERAGLYRTLRALEGYGYLTSTPDVDSAGPARRVYFLTPAGEQRLHQWAEVMEHMGKTMKRFAQKAK